MVELKHGKYRIGLKAGLAGSVLNQLVHGIEQPAIIPNSVLGGRGLISEVELDGIGPAVVKHYARGGVARIFNARWYLKCGSTRPEHEFDLLTQVRSLGILAPEPLAWVTEGNLLYRGWLITKKIDSRWSLAEASLRQQEEVHEPLKKLAQQLKVLIAEGIYHIDLHPGNVLIDRAGAVYLIDFDKARRFTGSKNKLRDLYFHRWRRAVIKHNLPEVLSEVMGSEIIRNYES